MRIIPSLMMLGLAGFVLSSSTVWSITIDQIRNTADLTPAKFASYFSEFEYKFRAEVQRPEVFLATRSGDCDDYATFAAEVLREKGYTPRLITVRMPKVVHVVCYIEETGSYLDYNNRTYMLRTVSCDSDLSKIAAKVAKSYQLDWTSVSEFTFSEGTKRLVKTELPMRKKEGIATKVAGIFGR